MNKYFLLANLAAIVLLSGCAGTQGGYKEVDTDDIEDAVPKNEPRSKYGNPSSYQVFGKNYEVKEKKAGFKERGHASWYGHPFHGRRTSSGETYDMYKMTAAHKTVPIPSYMKVTNLENGKTAIVRVNDRGPFHEGRIIDLSYVAAKKLGVHAKGIALVEVELLTSEPIPTEVVHKKPAQEERKLSIIPAKQNAEHEKIYVQVAAFTDPSRAEQVAVQLQKRLPNNPGSQVTSTHMNNAPVYRVRLGPFHDIFQAQQYIQPITQIYPDTKPVLVK